MTLNKKMTHTNLKLCYDDTKLRLVFIKFKNEKRFYEKHRIPMSKNHRFIILLKS